MSSISSKKTASVAPTALKKKTAAAPQQDAAPAAKNLLERVQAFTNLRFGPVIKELANERDPAEQEAMQVEQLLDMTLFFLNEMHQEDAVEFLQVCFQHLHRKKLNDAGMKLANMGDEPEWLRMIKFKPTHNAFRNLQGSYVDGRLHLSDLVSKGTQRLEKIQKELADESAQLE